MGSWGSLHKLINAPVPELRNKRPRTGITQQATVGSDILSPEVIGCGSIDFIRLRRLRVAPLFHGRFNAILFSVLHHLGDLHEVEFAKR